MKLDQMKAGTMGLSMGMSMAVFARCGTKDAGKGDGEGKDIILKGATQIGYPPFAYIDENGNHTGFDYELMKLIGERLDGYDVEVAAKEWENMFLSIDSGSLDMMAEEAAITPDREENYTFSEPYLEIQSVIVVKEGRKDIQTLDDLVGKHVGTFVDSYAEILEGYNDSHDEKIINEVI